MVFLKILQNSQENTSARLPFFKRNSATLLKKPATLLKKRLWWKCFPVNFAKLLRTPPDDCFCYRTWLVSIALLKLNVLKEMNGSP